MLALGIRTIDFKNSCISMNSKSSFFVLGCNVLRIFFSVPNTWYCHVPSCRHEFKWLPIGTSLCSIRLHWSLYRHLKLRNIVTLERVQSLHMHAVKNSPVIIGTSRREMHPNYQRFSSVADLFSRAYLMPSRPSSAVVRLSFFFQSNRRPQLLSEFCDIWLEYEQRHCSKICGIWLY